MTFFIKKQTIRQLAAAMILSGSSLPAFSQLAFTLPAHSSAAPVSAAEYFFDADPGQGNGLPLALTAGNNATLAPAINISTLPRGAHRLYIRARSASGQWSHTATAAFVTYSMITALPALQQGGEIDKAEYFLDTDPGYGNGYDIPLTAGTDIRIANIGVDITGRALGVHTLYFRARNTAGQWSTVTNAKFALLVATLASLPAHPAGRPVTGLEYFIDADPGFGQGTRVAVPATADLSSHSITADISGLAAGLHTLYVRSTDGPSMTNAAQFRIGGSPLPVRWISVSGRIQGDSALISWHTADEKSCQGYTVEHSSDGLRFRALGHVAADQSGATEHMYTFADGAPASGNNYYRIRQQDMDGKFTYSPVITMRTAIQPARITIGNPVTNTLVIQLQGSIPDDARISVLTPAGTELMTIRPGTQRLQADVSSLPAGIYLLRYTAGQEIATLKFVRP